MYNLLNQKEVDMEWMSRIRTIKLLTIAVVLSISLCACSSTDTVRSTAVQDGYTYNDMNGKLRGEAATIEFRNGSSVSANQITFSDDSVSWVDRRTDVASRARINQIDKIVLKDHGRGATEGLGFGLLAGVGGGLIAGVAATSGHHSELEGLGGLLIFAAGTVAGTVVGLMTGVIIGHTNNYEFQSTERSENERINTNVTVLHLKNGSTVRGTIIGELRDGSNLIQLTIRNLQGEDHIYNSPEIERIEKAK